MAEIKKPNRLPKDFDQMKPDVQITDPEGADRITNGLPLDREYPKHLHKFAGHGLLHDYVTVGDAKEEAQQRAKGYGSAKDADRAGLALLEAPDEDTADEDAPVDKQPRKPRKPRASAAAVN